MAELDVGTLSLTIEADGRAAIFELSRVKEAAEGASTDAARAYQRAGDDMADAFKPAAQAAENSFKEMLDSAERFGSTMSTAVTVPMLALYTGMVKGASDLTETISKAEVVFGEFSGDVMEWSEGAVASMGLAQATALDMASTFGDMATGMGLDQAAAKEMSTSLTQLAADLASFKNISADRASVALTGVYTGETEALKGLGIVMTQANLQAFAYAQGITEQVSAMSQAEQVQLRYQYVMAQTANAQGDFVRTGGNLANQGRALVQTLKQAGNAFGSLLTPAVTEAVSQLREGAMWLAELDDGTKMAILSIGGVTAAIGPLVLAGTKVVKLVTALKAAMSAAALGPVAIGIAAVTAGAIGLYNVLQKTNDEIDTTSDRYKRFQSILSGDMSVKIGVDDSELKQADGSTVTVNIDADGSMALEKAQRILTELQSEEYTGTLTIDGDPEKAQSALDGLETAVDNLLSGTGSLAELQAAVDACEELIISPDVNEERRAEVQAKLDELLLLSSSLKDVQVTFSVGEAADSDSKAWDAFHAKIEALGWETKEYTAVGKFSVDEAALANAEAYETALINAATATEGYEEAVNSLNNLLDEALAAQVTQINAQAAEQLDYQARMLNSGVIDRETYDANVQAIIDGAASATEALKSEYEITKQLNEQYKNGIRSDDYKVTGDQVLALSGGEGIREEDYQAALATLEAARAAGEDMSQYQTEAMLVNSQLAKNAIADYEALIAAQEEYSQTIAQANADQENAQTAMEDAEILQAAVDEYISILNKFDVSTEETLTQVGGHLAENAEEMGYSAEEVAALQQELAALLSGPEGLMSADEAGAEYGAGALLAAYQEQFETAVTEAEATRTTAAETFASALNGLTGEFTAAETQMIMEMVASTGAAISTADTELIAATESMIDEMASAAAEGGSETLDAVSGMIADVGNETTNAESEGRDVGTAIVAGITSGLAGGSGPLYSTARTIVNKAIAAMKQAAEIRSPSRRAMREIGAPFIQGIAAGAEDETPNMVRTIRQSVEHMITGATQVVNQGGYTVPAITALGASIDYDRMGEIMTDAVSALRIGIDMDGKEVARNMREDTARQQAARAREFNIGKGRIG